MRRAPSSPCSLAATRTTDSGSTRRYPDSDRPDQLSGRGPVTDCSADSGIRAGATGQFLRGSSRSDWRRTLQDRAVRSDYRSRQENRHQSKSRPETTPEAEPDWQSWQEFPRSGPSEDRLSDLRLVRLPSESGRVPLRSLLPSRSSVSALKLPSSAGMELLNAL